MTVEATTHKEKFPVYSSAYSNSLDEMKRVQHRAWRQYHRYYSRRIDGYPLMPTSDMAIASGDLGSEYLLSLIHI